MDLWPTVLELAGLPSQPDPDGHSRVPDIVAASHKMGGVVTDDSVASSGDVNDADDTVFALLDQTWGQDRREPEPLVAINRGRFRFFYPSTRPARAELYDKASDPSEGRNVIDAYPEVVAEPTRVAEEHLAGPPPPWGDDAPAIEMNDMQLQQLRALGYGVE